MRSRSLTLFVAGALTGAAAFAADYSPNVGPATPKKPL